MGYQGKGLGKDEQGIINPVEAVMKKSLEGGSNQLLDLGFEDDALQS